MVQSGGGGRRKNLNFDLNLVPFIDVLSTCICFLLVTAVFINLGAFHVNQALGTKPAAQGTREHGSVSVTMNEKGDLHIDLKGVAGLHGSTSVITIPGAAGKIDFLRSGQWIRAFAAKFSDVKTVLLLPNTRSRYDDLIQLMAQFKGSAMDQIGIAPL